MQTTTTKLLILSLLFVSILIGCNSDGDIYYEEDNYDSELYTLLKENSPTGRLDYYKLPFRNQISSIPTDPKNPLSQEKIELGSFLFHETGIGVAQKIDKGQNMYSCASCHQSGAAFQAGIAQGIGEGGMGFGQLGEGRILDPDYPRDSIDVQPIRTPTILNSCYQTNLLWNGQFGATGVNAGTEQYWTSGTPKEVNHLGYQGLETQAIAGMEVHRLDVSEDLLKNLGYKEMFDNVFADFPLEERYTRETAGLAIAAYERSVVANEAPFQKWLRAEGSLSESELKGAILFFGEANCSKCHNGPALNSMEFHALGMKDLNHMDGPIIKDQDDGAKLGRGNFTNNADDYFKFKVPQLYNLDEFSFLGHGSSFSSIRDVIVYKNLAIAENEEVDPNQLASDFVPLELTLNEINDLVAFVKNSLKDPDLERYVPTSLPSGNCFPNADEMSMDDLGCY